MQDTTVTAQVKAELSAIIKAAGITDPARASKMVEDAYVSVAEDISILYIRDGIRPKTHFAAVRVFETACHSISDADLSPKDQILTGQKIANVMFKNYSPVTFAGGKLDRYADNYVVNDSEILKEWLEDIKAPAENIEPLITEIQAALVGAPQNEQTKPRQMHEGFFNFFYNKLLPKISSGIAVKILFFNRRRTGPNPLTFFRKTIRECCSKRYFRALLYPLAKASYPTLIGRQRKQRAIIFVKAYGRGNELLKNPFFPLFYAHGKARYVEIGLPMQTNGTVNIYRELLSIAS
jgi:hypothetical protein